jgi:hypothetical protein
LYGWSEALFGPACQLALPQHAHELNTGQGTLAGAERFEPQHGPSHPLDGSLALLYQIVEILDLADDDRRAVRLVVPSSGGRLGLTPIRCTRSCTGVLHHPRMIARDM